MIGKMIFFPFLFLFWGSFNYVFCNNNFVTLDINKPDKVYYTVQTSEFDNVLYQHFTPVKQYFVLNVTETNNKIWESDGYCTCVYSLLAKSGNNPYLLYLVIDYGYTTNHLYYKKTLDGWNGVDVNEYSNSVTELKKGVKVEASFSINLSVTNSNEHYSVRYFSKDKPYRYFTPNIGFVATQVYHDNKKLWSSNSNDERCVAAWAYLHVDKYYMLRLLVSDSLERSQIRTYYKNNNNWYHVHTLNENDHDDLYIVKPDNFLYPNYTFNSKNLEFLLDGGKPKEVFNEVYFDLTGDYYKYNVQDDDNYDKPEFKNKRTPLDLSPSALNLLFTSSRCLDNVEYKIYSPTKNTVVTKVVQGTEVVWKSRSKNERCVYALAPQKDGNAVLLYLLLNVDGELRQAFMENVNGKWLRSSLYNYSKKLSLLKETVSHSYMKMDLFNKFHNSEYSVEYNSGSKAYYLFLPKLGYACNEVIYKDMTIWKPTNLFDKCVAVWSYESFGNVYYVKLLVSSPNGDSDFLTYLNFNNRWEFLDSYNKTVFNKSKYFNPGDFYHPEYPFNGFIPNYEFDGSEKTSLVPEFDESRFPKTPMYYTHFSFPQVSKPILETECLRVNLSQKTSQDYLVGEAMFDKKFNLVTYLPPPGKYFDLVYDENKLIYLGNYQTHLCKGVNVYTKDKEFYLTEVLLKVKNEDFTLHFKKQNNSWHYLTRETFLTTLNNY